MRGTGLVLTSILVMVAAWLVVTGGATAAALTSAVRRLRRPAIDRRGTGATATS